MIEKKYSEIIRDNELLKKKLQEKPLVLLKILSNITVNQLAPIIEYSLGIEEINAKVRIGEYDNIIQESITIEKNSIPIIFWELSNLIEGFVYNLEIENNEYFEKYIKKVEQEIILVLKNLEQVGIVIFNKFSHLSHTSNSIYPNKYEKFVNHINDFLEKNVSNNVILIDLNKPLSKVSLDLSFDWRGFFSSKILYTIRFLKEYAIYIKPIVLAKCGRSKKALIFDCDNTLWKGIVGEDGFDKIELSEKNKSGIYFKQIHLIAQDLSNSGIIIGLCSKNNYHDVDEVFQHREDFALKKENIVISKINWNDKASNLKEIAEELNIGLDSLVFIDDSSFEINLINEKLPDVKTITVPNRLYEYHKIIQENLPLFFSLNKTDEDKERVKMYKQNLERAQILNSFENIEDYLSKIDITLTITPKDISAKERIVQLTQKTNQFNLTTKRYANGDVQIFFDSPNYDVISLDVRDKFGNFGITGVCIIKYDGKSAFLDTFLMSCRILGRNIEKVFLREILKYLDSKGIQNIHASYYKTLKNGQVENFYESNGFELIESIDSEKKYVHSLNSNKLGIDKINYIKILWKAV